MIRAISITAPRGASMRMIIRSCSGSLTPLILSMVASFAIPATLTAQALARTYLDGPAAVEVSAAGASAPLERIGPFYYVQVQLDGRPFRFTVETGANHTAISERAARALGLRVDTIETRFGRAPAVTVGEIRIGDAVFRGVVARVNPMWTGEFDGILSVPLLESMRTTLDFPALRIGFERLGGAAPAGTGLRILDQTEGARFDVEVQLGATRLPAVLDTRSSFFLVAPDSLLPGIPLAGAFGAVINARGPSLGDFTLRPAPVQGTLSVGALSYAAPTVYFRNRPGVVIGMPLLEELVVTIDASLGMVWLRRGATQSRGPSPAPDGRPRTDLGFGLVPRPDGSKTVTAVTPESSAARQGIRDGDLIVSIDGVLAPAVNPELMRALATRTTPITVVISRAGVTQTFQILPHTRPEGG
jgi:predicted aspartyl protease